MKAFYSFLLLVAVALTACDEEITNKLIQLADGTSTSLVFNADESGNATIKFTADAAWTASVSEVAASKSGESISWLKLSSYGGEAGENTITVSLLKNYTGAFRKAEIKIACGDSEIVITVEQKGESSAGTVAKKIKKIVYEEKDNSSVDTNGTPYDGLEVMDFAYDSDGRVVRIIDEDVTPGSDDRYTYTTKFNYDVVGEIHVEEVEKEQGSDYTETENYTVKLDSRGNAVEVSRIGDDGPMARFGYTDDVRLAKIEEFEYGELAYTNIITYKDGLMSKLETKSKYNGNDVIDIDASWFANKNPNNGMIDMMGYLGNGFDFDFLYYIGRLGKSSDYFFDKMPDDWDEDGALNDMVGYTDPVGTVYKHDYLSSRSSGDSKITCEYDNEGNLTKVQQSYPYDVYRIYYEIRVTDEVVRVEYKDGNPENKNPENMVIYRKGVYQNESETPTGKSGVDYETYTISY